MNCKQGDLAVMVRSRAGNEGKIVRCIRLVEPGLYPMSTGIPARLEAALGPWWEVDTPLNHVSISPHDLGAHLGLAPYARDCQLRPLRPDEGEDETLTWAGKPNNVKEYCK